MPCSSDCGAKVLTIAVLIPDSAELSTGIFDTGIFAFFADS
jgi:hypothetical protein